MATKIQICCGSGDAGSWGRVLLTWPAKAEDWATAQQAAQTNPTAEPHVPQGVLFLLPRRSQPQKEDGHSAVAVLI